MNRKERDRIIIMAGVKAKELSQVQAAELLGLGYRQAKRIWRRYQDEGDAGRLRGGRPGEDDDGEAENGGEEAAAEEGHGTDSGRRGA